MISNRPITEFLVRGKPVFSVEFFPPKDENGGERILQSAREIREEMAPDFVSITYGAGGTTRERTHKYANLLKNEYGFEVMPHLTCVGSSKEELLEIIKGYQAEGFCNIMALRGDPPKGEHVFEPHPNGLPFASDLVKLIRDHFSGFSVGVAGYPEIHPESPSMEEDLKHLKWKVDMGASFITTQLFYDNQAYFRFVESCRIAGIDVPILPGLMPLRSATQAKRFCKTIPEELEDRLAKAGESSDKLRQVGIDWAIIQIKELLEANVPGVHLYIMNRSGMANEVMREIKKVL